MATVKTVFAGTQKPLTPGRITRYRELCCNPGSFVDAGATDEGTPVPARKSFLTHANSRVYPLNVMGARPQSVHARSSSISVTTRPPTQAAKRPPKRQASSHTLNLSVDSAVPQAIPRLEYRQFRRVHQQRHNNTTPGRRGVWEYSGAPAKVFYKPQVVKVAPRSKIIIHSSYPISLSAPAYPPTKFKKLPSRDELFADCTYQSPEKPGSSDSSPAITLADKISKLQAAAHEVQYA